MWRQCGNLKFKTKVLQVDKAGPDRDRMLCGYWSAGAQRVGAMAEQGSSAVFDFSRVGGHTVMVGATVTCESAAVYHPVQVPFSCPGQAMGGGPAALVTQE